MTVKYHDQRAESAILRAKDMKPVGSIFDYDVPEEGPFHTLEYDTTYTGLMARFEPIVGHPELVLVATRYWRAENEVCAVYRVEDARNLYRDLKAAGFHNPKETP